MLFDRLIYHHPFSQEAAGDVAFDSSGGDGSLFASTVPLMPDVSKPPPLVSSEDILKRGRELALGGVPLQVSGLLEALAQLRARASGSTADIFPSIIGQLSALRTQYAGASEAIAKRLGYAGGGQVKREQTQALAGAAQQYGGLIAGNQTASFANLINTLSGFQPALSAGARAPQVSIQPGPPVNFGAQGAGLASIIGAAKQIQSFYNNQGGVTTTGLQNSGLLPENIIT